VRDDGHAKTARTARDLPAHASHSDQTERFSAKLAADELRAGPFAGANAPVGLDDAAEESEREREGVLGGGDDIAERRVHDVHAAGRRRAHVDVVHADARATDDDEAFGSIKDRHGHLGLAADDQRVDIRDARGQVGLFQAGGLADLATRAEQRETLFGKRVRDVDDVAAASDESRPRRSPAVRSTRRGRRDVTTAAGSPHMRGAPRSSRRRAPMIG
jgi:hypothetical protein